MDIKEIAETSGIDVDEMEFLEDSAIFYITIFTLEAFAKAVIAEFVKEQKPVGTTYVSRSGYMEVELHRTVYAGTPLYTLEVNDEITMG